ncbi:hypothetical protein [Parasitella parasitica]|uniref:Uncharacterized protein n=1 Tax=Parasitella parasitica TaxID=35722 RepID=A0A0B7N163_9FUNG|nr:hypothetical protein [Parasitella parasitica]
MEETVKKTVEELWAEILKAKMTKLPQEIIDAKSTMSKAVLYLNSQTQETWDTENPSDEEKLKEAVFQKAELVVFADIGPLDAEMRYFLKGPSKKALDVLLNDGRHDVSWKSIENDTVTVNGKLSPPKRKGYIKALKGYEMLNSLEKEKESKVESISAVLKYLFSKLTYELKVHYKKEMNNFTADNVVFVLPVSHFYTLEERGIMMEAAKLAELSNHGHVLFEDSLRLLATTANRSKYVQRYVRLDAGKFESIDVTGNIIDKPCQLKKGFLDMVKDVEKLLRKYWLISTICTSDLLKIRKKFLLDCIYQSTENEDSEFEDFSTPAIDVDLEKIQKEIQAMLEELDKNMADGADENEFLKEKKLQMSKLVDQRYKQLKQIFSELQLPEKAFGDEQYDWKEVRDKLEKFENKNFPEDVNAEFKECLESCEMQQLAWEILHGNVINKGEAYTIHNSGTAFAIDSASFRNFSKNVIQNEYEENCLQEARKGRNSVLLQGNWEGKIAGSLVLHGNLIGMQHLTVNREYLY